MGKDTHVNAITSAINTLQPEINHARLLEQRYNARGLPEKLARAIIELQLVARAFHDLPKGTEKLAIELGIPELIPLCGRAEFDIIDKLNLLEREIALSSDRRKEKQTELQKLGVEPGKIAEILADFDTEIARKKEQIAALQAENQALNRFMREAVQWSETSMQLLQGTRFENFDISRLAEYQPLKVSRVG